MTIQPISPLEYITDRDPIPEEVMDTSSWFKNETMELEVGEYVGRPNEAALFHTSFIMPLLAEGWYIDAYLERGSGGTWKSAAKAKASQNGRSSSVSSARSSTSSSASSSATSETYTLGGGSTKGSSSGRSDGSTNSNGSGSTSGSSETTTEQDGGPWWYSYQKLRLKRRKMQSELVLKDMIASFTKAYNEGRQINDERYDELVALYALMLSRTEDEANASTEDFKPLADAVVAACKDALEKYGASVENLPADWMQSRIDEVNRKFDALVAQAKSKMVSEGTYNSTVWPTTVSGIERDRQIALNGLKDDMVTTKIDVLGKIAAMKADIGQKLLDCEIRIIEAQQKMLLGPTEVRNTVFKWMLDFMERRDDDYPGLEQLATIASQLGYAEGGAAGAGTAA